MKLSEIKAIKKELDDLNIQDWREVIEVSAEEEIFEINAGRNVVKFYDSEVVKREVVGDLLETFKNHSQALSDFNSLMHGEHIGTPFYTNICKVAKDNFEAFSEMFTLNDCLNYLGSDWTEITLHGKLYHVLTY